MTCKDCGKDYPKWLPEGQPENDLCPECNEKAWLKWEEEQAGNMEQIKAIEAQGHSHHCACRQIWGDGECECDLYAKGYDPYGWHKK